MFQSSSEGHFSLSRHFLDVLNEIDGTCIFEIIGLTPGVTNLNYQFQIIKATLTLHKGV